MNGSPGKKSMQGQKYVPSISFSMKDRKQVLHSKPEAASNP